MGLPTIDITGQKFERLRVLCFVGRGRHGKARIKCQRDCGGVIEAYASEVKRGKVRSCGCLCKTHGHAPRGKVTPEYRAWQNMTNRVKDTSLENYHNYGARGITVCSRWESFENFLEDMGERPEEGFSIDRINNDLGYFPENCRWATAAEQSRNKRGNHYLTHAGVTMCLMDWSKKLGIRYGTIYYRFHRGYGPDEILKTEKRKTGPQTKSFA